MRELIMAYVVGTARRVGVIVVLAALAAALIVGLSITCHRAAPAPAVVIAPVTAPPELVRAEAASAKAETVYVHVAATVAATAYTFDGARATVPAFTTADTAGRVRVDTAFVRAADSLRAAVPALESAALERHARDSTRIAALGQFVGQLQDTIIDLRREIARREEPCKRLGLPCPTRRQAAAAGVAVGLGAAAWLVHSLR